MTQFFRSNTVVNSILFVGKTWNFTKKDSIKDLTLLVKYIKASPDIIIKTSKYRLLYWQLWKIFVCWDKFGSHRSSNPELLFKKVFIKNFEKFARKCLSWSPFFEKKALKEKKNSSAAFFPWMVLIFFRARLLKVANEWLLLKAISRLTHQNLVNF